MDYDNKYWRNNNYLKKQKQIRKDVMFTFVSEYIMKRKKWSATLRARVAQLVR